MKKLIQKFVNSKNIALSVTALLLLGIPPATALNFGVSPSRVELDISSNKTRTNTIRVLNPSSQPLEVRATVQSWIIGKDNKLQVVPAEEQSLAQWITFTPSRFTIPPGGAQTVRFSVRPKVQPRPGEHRAVIYFQEIPSGKPKANTVRIIGKLGVVIYGYVGDIKRVGVLNSVNVDTKSKSVNAVFDVSSQGNGYVRLDGQYAIWPAAKYPGAEATKAIANLGKPNTKIPENLLDAGLLPNTPVLPGDRRQLQLPIKKTLPAGNYVLDINGNLSGVQINKGIPFTVPATKK